MGGKNLKDFGLPILQRHLSDLLSREMLRETSYDLNDLDKYVSMNESLVIQDQRTVYNAILNLVKKKIGGLFFLDAPRRTGKAFVTDFLLEKIRQREKIAFAIVSSGVAATLLHGDRSAHSILKLPLNLTHFKNSLCNISKGTGQAKILLECELIV